MPFAFKTVFESIFVIRRVIKIPSNTTNKTVNVDKIEALRP